MNKITIGKWDGTEEFMEVDEFARWMCLMEAFHFIEKKAEELKLDNVEKLVKPMAIERYIADRYSAMRHDVGVEHQLGNL